MKILGHKYRLTRKMDSAAIGGLGRTRCDYTEIQIACDLEDSVALSTVLHEIIEALNYHLGLNLEHHIIMALEAGLYQALVDNGVDLKPLMKELK